MKQLIACTLTLTMFVGHAQTLELGGFPEAATTISPEALAAAVTGKAFSVKPAQGSTWRWQFNANGYHYINVGSFSDSGKWSIKESSLCSEGRQIKFSCNEVRAVGTDLYLKRDSGEVVKLVVQ
jgi:hypothetical protein